VNTTAITARRLACLLADSADGIPAGLAAVELITRHDHFLHQPGFRRVIAAARAPFTGEPVLAIRCKAAIYALNTGRLPSTRSEETILRIAASLGDDDIPVTGTPRCPVRPGSLTIAHHLSPGSPRALPCRARRARAGLGHHYNRHGAGQRPHRPHRPAGNLRSAGRHPGEPGHRQAGQC
jgi:hypothetical protein